MQSPSKFPLFDRAKFPNFSGGETVKRQLSLLLSLVVLTSLLLAACGTPATQPPATQPPATQPPATEPPAQPTATEAPAYEGMSKEAPDCNYGGEVKKIEAVDQFTVKITLCTPDPAFPAKIAFTSFAVQPAEYLQSTGATGDILEKPIGTGP
jgi:ABC-type oligopeptide transport system substrate-binding subunit